MVAFLLHMISQKKPYYSTYLIDNFSSVIPLYLHLTGKLLSITFDDS